MRCSKKRNYEKAKIDRFIFRSVYHRRATGESADRYYFLVWGTMGDAGPLVERPYGFSLLNFQ